MRRLRFTGLVVLLGLGLAASGLVCQRVAARGRYAVPYSSVGAGEDGARGLFLLAQGRGARPLRWLEDLGGLPSGGMLVALGGCEAPMRRPLSRHGQNALVEWIEAGGVLFVAGAHGYLFDELGVSLTRSLSQCDPKKGILGMIARARRGGADAGVEKEDAEPPEILAELMDEDQEELPTWAVPRGDLFAEMGPVPLSDVADIEMEDEEQAEVLLAREDGAPAAVSLARGRGAVVVFASSTPFQNRALEESLGGVIFARLLDRFAPEGPIYFDEYHLGLGSSRSIVRYVRGIGGTPLLLQFLVILGLVVWRQGARFGAPRVPVPEPPGGTVSYVQSIARLYQKVRDDAGAVHILVRHALGRIARYHHTDRTEPDALRAELEARGRDAEGAAVARLGAIPDELRGRRISLTDVSRTLDSLTETAGVKATQPQGEDR